MYKNLVHLTLGYMVILVHEKSTKLQKCESSNNNLTVTCTNIKPTLPSNLSAKIETLNILDSPSLIELTEANFKPYPNILVLRFLRIALASKETIFTDKFIFRPLTKLREMYFEAVHLEEASTFFWPETIEILNITSCFVKSIDLSHAAKLRILHADYNNLDDLPNINELAPMEFVSVNFNPLNAVTVSSLARLCRVKNISMFPVTSSALKTAALYCACTAILDWLKKFNVTNNIVSGDSELVCTVPISGPPSCDNQITPEAIKVRDECLAKKAETKATSLWFVFVIIGSVLALLLALLFFAYMYGSLQRKAELGEVVEIHHGKSEAVEESSVEEEQAAVIDKERN